MNWTRCAVLAALVASPLRAAPLRADLAAGAGYDSNVHRAVAGQATEAAPYATVWLSLGGTLASSYDDELFLDAAYDGAWTSEAPELDLHRLSLSLGFAHFFSDHVIGTLGTTGAYRLFSDSSRSGPELGVAAALKVRLSRPFALRLSASWSRRTARDETLDYQLVRGRLGAELRLSRRLHATPYFALEWTRADVVPAGGAGEVSLFGLPLTLSGAEALTHLAGMDAFHDVGRRVYLFASYAFARSERPGSAYQTHLVSAGLGVRL